MMRRTNTSTKNHALTRDLHTRLLLSAFVLFCAVTLLFTSKAFASAPLGDDETAIDEEDSNVGEQESLSVPGNDDKLSEQTDSATGANENTAVEKSGDEQNMTAPTGATGGEISLVNHYDSEDLCVFVRHDSLRKTLTFRNHDVGKNYSLLYDDSTYILDEHDRTISPDEFQPGDMVRVTFLKSNRVINAVRKVAVGSTALSDGDVFCITDLEQYTLPVTVAGSTRIDKQAILGGKKYVFDYRTLVIADGKVASPASIMEGDLITVWGIGNEVYSVRVSKGHGYLRLSSTQVGQNSIVGAWIELDNFLVRKITEDMLITVTEGEYTLYVVGQGANWSTPVSVTRGKETIIDTSGIEIAEPDKGTVNFITAPKETGIIIDGEDLGKVESVTLEYGIHTLELYAEGYVTEVKYLRVGSKEADIRLVLTADDSATNKNTTDTSDATDTSAASSSTTTTGAASASGTSTGTTQTSTGATTNSSDDAQTATTGTGAVSSAGSSDTASQSASTGASWTSPTGSGVQAGVKIENQWIHVEAPTGSKLYVDGTYIGEIPAVFEKVTGIHTVNIRRDGYKIISYNIEVDDAKSDLYFRFPEMETE